MATATYSDENMTVQFTARMARNDYGVPGSPVWYEPEDIEIDALEILGVPVDPKTLPDALVCNIIDLADYATFEE